MNELKQKIADLIKKMPLTSALDEKEQGILLQYIEIKHFLPSEIVLKQGHKVKGLYNIGWGQAQVSAKLPAGQKTELIQMKSDDFFGEIVLLHGGVASATIQAVTALSCLFFSIEVINALKILFPVIYYKLTSAIAMNLCERIVASVGKIASSSDVDVIGEPKIPQQIVDEDSLKSKNISLRLLRSLHFFKPISDQRLKELLPYFKLMDIPQNTSINEILSNHYLFLIQGGVEVVHSNGIDKLGILGTGNILMNVYYGNKPCTMPIHYVTRERSLAFVMSNEVMLQLYHSDPALFYALHFMLVDQLAMLLVAINKQLLRLEVQIQAEYMIDKER